jgi:hypothetical protein
MDVVAGFKKFIDGFSGKSPPSVAVTDYLEIENTVTWQSDFCKLYEKGIDLIRQARADKSASTPVTESSSKEKSDAINQGPLVQNSTPSELITKLDIPQERSVDFGQSPREGTIKNRVDRVSLNFLDIGIKTQEDRQSLSVVPAPPKQNIGRNIPVSRVKIALRHEIDDWLWVCRSKLFRCIFLLLAGPLILATIAICCVVAVWIVKTVPDLIFTLDDQTRSLSRDALASYVVLKSRLVEERLTEPFRDLYTLSRVANWVHSGHIPLSGSFVETDYATEQCKSYNYFECPLLYDEGRFVCLCEWDDPLSIPDKTCRVENDSLVSRSLQKRFYACQSKGTDPITGERRNGTGIVVDDSPEATEWWSDPFELPGAQVNDTSPTHATTYGRALISSSFSTVEFPLYNYATALGRPKHHLGTFTAYEADGFFAGFQGCQFSHPSYALWSSTNENNAAVARPLLCPLGEYGYDPRCRPWYSETLQDLKENGSYIHLTPPYPFSDGKISGFSVVSPILDQATNGDPIGQVSFDFVPNGMWEAFESIDMPLSFMVATASDLFGGDTVIGPNRTQGWSSAKMIDLLFPADDYSDSRERQTFEEDFLQPMKEGKAGTGTFRRTDKGGNEEIFTMSYYPVYQRYLRPVNSANMSGGVLVERRQIYSIGIASYDDELELAFQDVKDDLDNDLRRLAIIDIVLAVVLASLFAAFAFRVSPVLVLRVYASLLFVLTNAIQKT